MKTEPRQQIPDIDLTDLDVFVRGEHHAVFKRLRAECPVFYNERSWGPGFWNIVKYQDLIRVSRDPETFISGKGIILDNDGFRTSRQVEAQVAGQMMIMTDPPRHTRLRQLVNRGFTPRAVQNLEPHVRDIVTKLIDDVADRKECDFVRDISRNLPLAVICEMMGVPEGEWERMFELTNRIIGFDDPEFSQRDISQEEMAEQMGFFQSFMGLINERRESPGSDLMSTLVTAEIDGEGLSDPEIYFFFILLIVAGNETTRNATTGGMLELIRHPDQRAKLIENPSLIPSAVEEIVRWTSPVMSFYRTATKDVELRGELIREGDQVCLWYPAVNRDEEIFGDDADSFRIDRDPNEHLAFGIGEHYCLGANLARLELIVMFEELLKRIPDMELNGEPERLRSNFIGGIKRMPVRWSTVR